MGEDSSDKAMDLIKWVIIGAIAIPIIGGVSSLFGGDKKQETQSIVVTLPDGNTIPVNVTPRTDRAIAVQYWNDDDFPTAKLLAKSLGAALIRTDSLQLLQNTYNYGVFGNYRVVCVGGWQANPIVKSLFGENNYVNRPGTATIMPLWNLLFGHDQLWAVYGWQTDDTLAAAQLFIKAPFPDKQINFTTM